MLPRLLKSLAALLYSYIVTSDPESSLQVHKQIQVELEQAVEQGMVSTRSGGSQDNTSASVVSQDAVLRKKRKTNEEKEWSSAQPMMKRRRRSLKSSGDLAPPTSTSKPDKPHRRSSAKTINGDKAHVLHHKKPDQESSSQGSSPASPPVTGIATDRTVGDEEAKAIEMAMNKLDHTQNVGSELSNADGQVKPGTKGAMKLRRKGSEGVATTEKNGVEISTIQRTPETVSATAAKATHKRFGSEDIGVQGTISSVRIDEQKGSPEEVSGDESESGDEAPEMVTASAGFDKARTSALEAAKVTARQKAEKKSKRREHDQRLRLQAKSAEKFRHNDRPSTKRQRKENFAGTDIQIPVKGSKSAREYPKTINDEALKPTTESKTFGKTPLPLLLPEEILAAEPVIHAPRAPMPNSRATTSQKRKFLDLESKPPKDIRRGDVTISVLQDSRSILPPKSCQLSRSIRETWLIGRRGFKGEIAVPRRKLSAGFVRRN